jgi:hypothetical protein
MNFEEAVAMTKQALKCHHSAVPAEIDMDMFFEANPEAGVSNSLRVDGALPDTIRR